MKRLQAYKFEITPNGEQIRMMRKYAGNARKVWNLALDRQEKNHAAGEKFTGAKGMNYWIPEWKKEFPFLCESPAQTLQQVMENLAKGYEKFFKKTTDHPVFKKKGKSADSFRFPEPKQFTVDQGNSRIKLPKLGWIRYRNSRAILGSPKNITVSAKAGKWFFSVQTEREVDQPFHPATSMIGIDVGITRFATLSDATYIEPLSAFRKHEVKLAKYQRRMSRKIKFSSNWKKAKARIQEIHNRIGNVRNDFLHKSTTTISKNHAIVCIEDLQVGNMSRSAAAVSKSMTNKILVTGGAGYIGSHTCVELLAAGYELVVVDNFSNSKPIALERVQKIAGKGLAFHQADIRDRHALREIFKQHQIKSVTPRNGCCVLDSEAHRNRAL